MFIVIMQDIQPTKTINTTSFNKRW